MIAKAGRQALRALEHAPAFRIGNVLAEDQYGGVGFHRLHQRPVDGLDAGDLGDLGVCAGAHASISSE